MKALTLLLVIVLLSTATATAQTPKQVYAKMNMLYDSVSQKNTRWNAACQAVRKGGNYGTLKQYSDDLLRYINNNLPTLNKMKDIDGSNGMKLALMNVMGNKKVQATRNYKKMETFTKRTPAATVAAQLAEVVKFAYDGEVYVEQFQRESAAYGGKHGFEVESAGPTTVNE